MLISTALAAVVGASQTHPAGPDGCLEPKDASNTLNEEMNHLHILKGKFPDEL